MSRNGRRREEPPSRSSHWEPGYDRSYSDGYSRRRHGPLTRSSFNYWREDDALATSSYHRRPYRREGSNERRGDDRRHSHAESSYSRRRRDSEAGRDRDDPESRRDDGRHHRYASSRPRHSAYVPYDPRPTFRAKSPAESNPLSLPKLASPEPSPTKRPRKMSPPPPFPPARKTSPPPTVASQALRPSSRYISLSQEPSKFLHDHTKARKLLVLDLNGTLLIRSARSRMQLRPVQPRPYMESFRQYLFCLETKAWLDSMVWSSAQPHSVKDMVDKVFGTSKTELKATWNRKSFGLSEAEYHQKTVTTKDLEKAWGLFTPAVGPKTARGHFAVQSQSPVIHSALTTLLLDDSPHKAVLQPYSHVCIPEYDSARRRHDLRSFLAIKEPEQSKKAKRKDQDGLAGHLADQTVPEPIPTSAPMALAEKEPYDDTLLAVIGILEAVKLQSNVAGWIRKGGLWGREERGEEAGVSDVTQRVIVRTGNGASSAPDPGVPVQDGLTKMWFEDLSVVAFWVAKGRKALMDLGIQAVHGVVG